MRASSEGVLSGEDEQPNSGACTQTRRCDLSASDRQGTDRKARGTHERSKPDVGRRPGVVAGVGR